MLPIRRRRPQRRVRIAEILRQHNITKATYFHWRAKYAVASVDELKQLREHWLALARGGWACSVPSAPGAASIRVWHLMSRGRRPPPPEGVHVTSRCTCDFGDGDHAEAREFFGLGQRKT